MSSVEPIAAQSDSALNATLPSVPVADAARADNIRSLFYGKDNAAGLNHGEDIVPFAQF